jgi:predicted lipoprotein with Yx(FWY)xxD motif
MAVRDAKHREMTREPVLGSPLGPRARPARHLSWQVLAIAVLLLLGGLGASACQSKPAAAPKAARSVVVKAAKVGTYGSILVAGNGETLYHDLKDIPPHLSCISSCLKIWPPLLLPKGTTTATAGTGVSESALGTVPRAHGRLQVTFMGKPLYYYSGDTAPGQTKGEGLDGRFFVVESNLGGPS